MLLDTAPLVTAALVTGIFTLGTGLIGGVFYVWRRDPASARNGVLIQTASALLKLAQVTERMNAAHDEYLRRIEEQDTRNRQEHQAMMHAIETLTDLVAPRRAG